MTVDCGINDFAKYPFDSPVCTLNLSSFSQSSEQLDLFWLDSGSVHLPPSNLVIPGLDLISNETSQCEHESFGKTFPCIQVTLKFTRHWVEVFAKVYEPLTTLVLFAYLSLYLKDGSQRVTVSSLSLMIAILLDSFNSYKKPRTSVVTLVDRWADVCVAFCFLSLLIVVIFESLRRRKSVVLAEREERNYAAQSPSVQDALITSLHNRLVLQQSKVALWLKILYPLAFLLLSILHLVFILRPWIALLLTFARTWIRATNRSSSQTHSSKPQRVLSRSSWWIEINANLPPNVHWVSSRKVGREKRNSDRSAVSRRADEQLCRVSATRRQWKSVKIGSALATHLRPSDTRVAFPFYSALSLLPVSLAVLLDPTNGGQISTIAKKRTLSSSLTHLPQSQQAPSPTRGGIKSWKATVFQFVF